MESQKHMTNDKYSKAFWKVLSIAFSLLIIAPNCKVASIVCFPIVGYLKMLFGNHTIIFFYSLMIRA